MPSWRLDRRALICALALMWVGTACSRDDVPDCVGRTPDCATLGRKYEVGDGVTVDATMAGKLYDRGCDAGEAKACQGLGRVYEGDSPALSGSGVGTEADAYMKGQVPNYEKACAAGEQAACEVLGDLYAGGMYGMPKSNKKALELYAGACKRGSGTACNKAKRLEE